MESVKNGIECFLGREFRRGDTNDGPAQGSLIKPQGIKVYKMEQV